MWCSGISTYICLFYVSTNITYILYIKQTYLLQNMPHTCGGLPGNSLGNPLYVTGPEKTTDIYTQNLI